MSISDTFKRVKKWKEELTTFNPNTIIAISGNKCDLKRDVEEEVVNEYAEQEHVKHFYSSAKTGEGLEEIFQYVTKEIVNTFLQSTPSKENKKKLILSSTQGKTKERGCCK